MDPITLSRLQFGLTTIYHWLFVPLTLGIGWYVAYMQTRYYQTRDENYRKMAKFWGKMLLINFAIGVVTGIVQEFQFGMNWSEYSRYVGDIFGAPLAIEALVAFFLESTFMGIWIFGEGRVSERIHLASIWLVAIGSNFSAIWILIANGWMQHPVGYVVNEATGRAELVDFFALISNPKAWLMIWHTLAVGLATASFFIIGISAYHLIRKQYQEIFYPSFRMAALVGLIASVFVFMGGHTMGQEMYVTQPMKLAALEGIWETEQPAAFSLLTIGDLSGRQEIWSIRIPYAMSFLACNNFECEVKGVHDLQVHYEQLYGPGDYIPLMVVTYWTFRFMMVIGFIMMGAAAYFLYVSRKKDFAQRVKWFRRVPFWAILLPYIANISGWVLTEMGRQPWIVYGLLKVEDAVSPNLTTVDLLISVIGYTLVYGALAAAMYHLMKKYVIAGPEATLHPSVDVAPSFVGGQD